MYTYILEHIITNENHIQPSSEPSVSGICGNLHDNKLPRADNASLREANAVNSQKIDDLAAVMIGTSPTTPRATPAATTPPSGVPSGEGTGGRPLRRPLRGSRRRVATPDADAFQAPVRQEGQRALAGQTEKPKKRSH